MRRVLLSGLVLVGTSVAAGQPPKAALPGGSPRPLPGLPATPLEHKTTPALMEHKTTPALIKVKVPENATLWFESQKMSQPGMTRIFQSPGLEAKKTYYYKVKVSWPIGVGTMAKDFVTEQEVAVRGGETTTVDFMPLATHTKEVRPTSTREMIRQAAHNVQPPGRRSSKDE